MRIVRALAVGVALLVALPVVKAAAQAPPPDYRRVIGEAVGEFEEGNWPEARALFEQAHALYPNARTLRGIGMCAFEMRDYDDAVSNLLHALEDPRRALTPEQRVETEELTQRAMTFVGRYALTLEPTGAQLTVDDRVMTPNRRGELLLAVGEHEIVVRAGGHETLRRRVDVHGGENEDLVLTLAPTQAGGLPDPPVGAIALWIAGGALLLGEPIVIGWLVEREGALADCQSPPVGFRCDNEGTIAEQRDIAIGMSVALGVAALAVASVGLLVWILSGDDERGASLECRPGLGGLSCSF